MMISSLHTNVKSLKKNVEEAEHSGKLLLNNRKLKDLSVCSGLYDLSDITHLDCSKNLLYEVPLELCEWYCLKRVYLSHNVIKVIPDFLTSLCLIEVLDLSNNQIGHLPSNISEMKGLIVLLLQNNKIVSVPSAISKLEKCEKLDLSMNDINNLPVEIGSMPSLKHLDVSCNNLYDLPDELATPELVYLNASTNKISKVPLCFQDMKAIHTLSLHDNPLTIPSLSLLRKGRVHMFKSMQNESMKSKRQLEKMEPLLSRKRDRSVNKPVDYALVNVLQNIAIENHIDNSSEKTENDVSVVLDNAVQTDKVQPVVDVQENHEDLQVEASLKELVAATNIEQTCIDECLDENNLSEKNSPKTNSPEKVPLEKHQHDIPAPTIPAVEEKSINTVSSPKKQSPKKNLSPKKNHSPIKSPTMRNFNTEMIHAKPKIHSFPGYSPAPPIKEKPIRKKISHLYQEKIDQTHYLEVIKPRTAFLNRKKVIDIEGDDMSFTMRRKTEKFWEELDLLEQLRTAIGSTLKMPLPQELLPSLTDGVILCHLANHVKSRSIATIHVPSPAVPKLSLAKCRRNVDNFLDACIKLGVPQSKLCSANDIMHGKGLARIVTTVQELLKTPHVNSDKLENPFSSVRIAPSINKSQYQNNH